ncbi:guanine nucleotide-binding -like 1, partial [Brachionus plicatilis]
KQKKQQLITKRERKRNKDLDTSSSDIEPDFETQTANLNARRPIRNLINPEIGDSQQENNRNKFKLLFLKESPEEIKRRKAEASKKLTIKSESDLEVDIEDVYNQSSPLDIPIRPKWSYDMTKEQLDQQEKKYISEYLDKICDNYQDQELSYFEMNLETWRQLWRVTEISDIILIIVDVRYSPLHFSPKFYEYCTDILKKDIILILNKIDLIPSSVVIAWKNYFESKFPNLHVVLFSSAKQIKHKRKKARKSGESSKDVDQEYELEVKALAAEINTAKAHRKLYECVKKIVKNQVDLSGWSKMTEELCKKSTISEPFEAIGKMNISENEVEIMDSLYFGEVPRVKYEHGFVTIGCCGFPNVGKSSLLNSLNGRKVVSVSRTPGHTKHLQTIFLTKNVRLCDCPGLVFPSLVCKPLQIIAGIYPISQLQEPYSAIRYIAERIPLIENFDLKHPSETSSQNNNDWSPLDICEAWAIKRGYFTAKASRPDVFRAANELLRMTLDGAI